MALETLEHLAFRIENSKGRRHAETILRSADWDTLTPYWQDDAKIFSSNAWGQLVLKKQVVDPTPFRGVGGRFSHSFRVREIAGRIAELLLLREDLCRTMAIAHDLGQPAFAHNGEIVLSEYLPGFCHENFGVILVQEIEDLNLTYEVLQGILYHSISNLDRSDLAEEHRVLIYSDKIAYILTDATDLYFQVLRGKQTGALEIPRSIQRQLLSELSELIRPFEIHTNKFGWIKSIPEAVAQESLEVGRVSFQHSPLAVHLWHLRDWLYQNIYPFANLEPEKEAYRSVIEHFCNSGIIKPFDPLLVAALMHDQEVLSAHKMISGTFEPPSPWGDDFDELIERITIDEFHLPPRMRKINLVNPDISWGK